MTAEELPSPNVTQEMSNATAVVCDEEAIEPELFERFKLHDIFTTRVFAPAEVGRGFIFVEDQDITAATVPDTEGITANYSLWYSDNLLKHNRIIPMQYYHKSRQTQPYLPRHHSSQHDQNQNLGTLVDAKVF